MVDYLLANGYNLKDWTGYPTTWARWSPDNVNSRRSWSDERGVQSMQLLAFVAAAQNVSAALPAGEKTIARQKRWAAAYAELTNASNDYEGNLLNLKIEATCDDNFSDDELTFMPYPRQYLLYHNVPELL